MCVCEERYDGREGLQVEAGYEGERVVAAIFCSKVLSRVTEQPLNAALFLLHIPSHLFLKRKNFPSAGRSIEAIVNMYMKRILRVDLL